MTQDTQAAQPAATPENLPPGLKHVKALTFDAFIEAYRLRGQAGAFEQDTGKDDRRAILYLDKQTPEQDVSQDIWLEYVPERNTINYVFRLVDHTAGEALAQTECEISMARAAFLLDQSIEQQLGLKALQHERAKRESERKGIY